MKKFDSEVAEQLSKAFESDEVRELFATTEKAAPEDTGTFKVVITTENLDRYEEVVRLDGWDLSHYLNNPVVLWGHDHNRPIGVATNVYIEDGKMIAEGKFAPHPFAQEIRQMYDAGIVRATSVGFIERDREGNVITKAELLEFSFVSVPANPHALSLALQHELNINELVTKGIFHIRTTETSETEETPAEDDSEASEETSEDEPEEPETIPEKSEDEQTEPSEAEKAMAEITAAAVIRQLEEQGLINKADDGALEDTQEGDPERTDDEPEGEEDDDAVKEFNLKRDIQKLDTTLGDVLAELRQKHARR